MDDISDIVSSRPHTLIVGTGDPGLMRPEAGLPDALGGHGIRLEVLATELATERFNALCAQLPLDRLAAAFHLTC